MEREVGGGIGMGNTCKPMADSFQCMTKPTTVKKKLKKKEDKGFPGGSDGKEAACNAEDLTLIPGLGRSPGGGHGNPLQYSCLENPMDRGAWRASFHGVAKSWTQLSN